MSEATDAIGRVDDQMAHRLLCAALVEHRKQLERSLVHSTVIFMSLHFGLRARHRRLYPEDLEANIR